MIEVFGVEIKKNFNFYICIYELFVYFKLIIKNNKLYMCLLYFCVSNFCVSFILNLFELKYGNSISI